MMELTIEQLKTEHAKVKSGADFPVYIRAIRQLGVSRYDTFVSDGRTVFHTRSGTLAWEPKYAPMRIAENANGAQLERDLRAHQNGGSDYPTFCRQAAANGVSKWTVDLAAMTCTYKDTAGQAILVEKVG